MSEKTLSDLINEYEGKGTPLPSSLPKIFPDPSLKPTLAEKGRELEEYRVRYAALEAGLDPDDLAGMAFQESGFNSKAKSNRNAHGTMQVIPSTMKEMGFSGKGTDDNIRAGIAYYKKQLEDFKDPDLARAAYNAGPANVRKYKGVPPFDETKNYVAATNHHSMKSKDIRSNTPQTVEEALSALPDDMFDEPIQESNPTPDSALKTPVLEDNSSKEPPSTIDNILSYLKTKPLDKEGNPIEMPGIMGTTEELPSPGDILGRSATLASTVFGGPATAAMAKGASKIPAVASVLEKGGKGATAIKTAIQSLYGAGTGAGIQTARGHPEEAATAAIIGGTAPIVLQGMASSINGIANKMGDISLKAKGMGQWVNKTFGRTKSLKSLSSKNKIRYANIEKQLQSTLENADNELGQLHVDKSKLGARVVGTGKKAVEENVLHRAAREALADEGEKEVSDILIYLGDKINRNEPMTRIELNLVKRAIYTYGNSWTKAGSLKSNEFAKNTAKMATYVRKMIEDNTDETVALLNQEESSHMALTTAIAKKMSKKPSLWSTFSKLTPAAAMGSAAGVISSPVLGTMVGGGALVGQTVPGFTTAASGAHVLENPEIQRILSILVPQLRKGDK